MAVGCGRKGKGSTTHVLTDGIGTPLAVKLTGAQVHELRVALKVVDQVSVRRRRGRPRKRPEILGADKGYDSRGFRRELRRRGIRPSIPLRRWPGRRRRPGRPPKLHPASADRWVVERTHAWMDNWRRLVTRWERRAPNYLAFLIIACFMTCLRLISG